MHITLQQIHRSYLDLNQNARFRALSNMFDYIMSNNQKKCRNFTFHNISFTIPSIGPDVSLKVL